MRRKKLFVIFLFTILFFLTVRIQTKGEIVTQPLIDSNEIDQVIAQLENDDYINQVDKSVIINDIIYMKLGEKALVEEAELRGISITDEELTKHIEEQILFFKEAFENDEIMRESYEDIFARENITLEEYFWDYQYDTIKRRLMISKLYDQVMKEDMALANGSRDYLEELQKDYLEENKDKIERLKRKYGVLEIEQPEYMFF